MVKKFESVNDKSTAKYCAEETKHAVVHPSVVCVIATGRQFMKNIAFIAFPSKKPWFGEVTFEMVLFGAIIDNPETINSEIHTDRLDSTEHVQDKLAYHTC